MTGATTARIEDHPLAPSLAEIGAALEYTWSCDRRVVVAMTNLLYAHPQQADALLDLVEAKLPGVPEAALWSLWGWALGVEHTRWLDALWQDLGARKNPATAAIGVVRNLSVPSSQVNAYRHLHGLLARRGRAAATRLSAALADEAVNHAFCGVWQGSGTLMAHILAREGAGFCFPCGGRSGGWFRSLGLAVGRVLDKEEPQRSALLTHRGVGQSMALLVERGVRASNQDGLLCGIVLLEGMDVAQDVMFDLLDQWMEAGGAWRELWNMATPAGHRWLLALPRVRRELLSGDLDDAGEVSQADGRGRL